MDPKLPPGRTGADRAKGPFREALVFMIGGGNYLERETLAAWASRSQPPRQVGGMDAVCCACCLALLFAYCLIISELFALHPAGPLVNYRVAVSTL